MSSSVSAATRRGFYPVLLVVIIVFLSLVYVTFDPQVALKGSYVLGGVLLSFLLYRWKGPTDGMDTGRRTSDLEKTVGIVVSLSIAVAAIWNTRLVVLFVGVPLGYTLIVKQAIDRVSTWRLLPQILAVWAVSPLSKVLTTGLYFGQGDTLNHVRFIELVMQTGSVGSIGTTYSMFPVLYILASVVGHVTRLPAYWSFVGLGIATFAFGLTLVYVLFASLIGRRGAVAGVLGATILTPTMYYAVYFFPQSLATIVALFIIYLAFAVKLSTRPRRFQVVAVLAALTLVLSHHLTLFLFVPIVVGLLVAVPIFERVPHIPDDFGIRPWGGVFAIVGLSALFYWTLSLGVGFYYGFVETPLKLLAGQFLSGGGGGPRTLFTFGTVPTTTRIIDVGFVYMLLLVAVFVQGLRSLLDSPRRYAPATGMLTVGVGAGAFVFESPLSFKSWGRITMPFHFFFALVLGIGLVCLFVSTSDRTGRIAAAVLLVTALGTTGAMTAADDVYSLQGNRVAQTEFSDGEVAQLERTSRTVDRLEASVSTFWITRVALQRFSDVRVDRPTVSNSGIQSNADLFLYRQRWPDHQIRFKTESNYLGRIVLSDSAFARIETENSKVYTTGRVHMIWTPNETVLDARADG